MNITNLRCKNKTDHDEEWYYEIDDITYVYSTLKPFMTMGGERTGRTYVGGKYPPQKRYKVGELPQYLPVNPKAPEKSIERFYQLLLLS